MHNSKRVYVSIDSFEPYQHVRHVSNLEEQQTNLGRFSCGLCVEMSHSYQIPQDGFEFLCFSPGLFWITGYDPNKSDLSGHVRGTRAASLLETSCYNLSCLYVFESF